MNKYLAQIGGANREVYLCEDVELALASERLKVEKLKEIACNCEPMIGFTCPLHDGSWEKSQETNK